MLYGVLDYSQVLLGYILSLSNTEIILGLFLFLAVNLILYQYRHGLVTELDLVELKGKLDLAQELKSDLDTARELVVKRQRLLGAKKRDCARLERKLGIKMRENSKLVNDRFNEQDHTMKLYQMINQKDTVIHRLKTNRARNEIKSKGIAPVTTEIAESKSIAPIDDGKTESVSNESVDEIKANPDNAVSVDQIKVESETDQSDSDSSDTESSNSDDEKYAERKSGSPIIKSVDFDRISETTVPSQILQAATAGYNYLKSKYPDGWVPRPEIVKWIYAHRDQYSKVGTTNQIKTTLKDIWNHKTKLASENSIGFLIRKDGTKASAALWIKINTAITP